MGFPEDVVKIIREEGMMNEEEGSQVERMAHVEVENSHRAEGSIFVYLV